MKFGEKLIAAGLINEAQLDAALRHQTQTGQMLGEALLELGYVSEDNYLKFLAREFSTQYVSTGKLARAKLSPELLKLFPMQLAERCLMFPILKGKGNRSLGVLSCEPQKLDNVEEVRVITGVDEVRVFVAQRDAIRSMIKKHYQGDLHAFDILERSDRKLMSLLDKDPAQASLPPGDIQIEEISQPQSRRPLVADGDSDSQASEGTSSWTRAMEGVRESSLVSDNDFIETLNILVGLLEIQTPNRQGHSARVARWVKAVSEAMGLSVRQVNHNITSAYLHDLGKRVSIHLTLPSIASSDEYRKRARRYHLTPSRLFDGVHLPVRVNQTLAHLYENFDGSGIPDNLAQEQIPLGARLIATIDAFDDLTNNAANPAGATMEPAQALTQLKKQSGSLFDPLVIEVLENVVKGEVARLGTAAGSIVLIADPSPQATAELELKLGAADFQVRIARDSETAVERLAMEEIAAIFLEVGLPPDGGFSVLANIFRNQKGLPVFMMSADPSPDAITRAFREGACDLLTKPFMPTIAIAKLKKELSLLAQPAEPPLPEPPLEQKTEEPSIPIEVDDIAITETIDLPSASSEEPAPAIDISAPSGGGYRSTMEFSGKIDQKTILSLIRTLSAKRRTGTLYLLMGEQQGEIFFQEGHIHRAASEHSTGEEAFLELAAWSNCIYRFDPEQTSKAKAIRTPTSKLLQIAALSS